MSNDQLRVTLQVDRKLAQDAPDDVLMALLGAAACQELRHILLGDDNPCHPRNGGLAGKPPGGGLLPFCPACGSKTIPARQCANVPGCVLRPLGA